MNKWIIESITQIDKTITVRIAVLNENGDFLLNDQNSLPDTATKEQIAALCNEMAARHEKPAAKDFSHLVGLGG